MTIPATALQTTTNYSFRLMHDDMDENIYPHINYTISLIDLTIASVASVASATSTNYTSSAITLANTVSSLTTLTTTVANNGTALDTLEATVSAVGTTKVTLSSSVTVGLSSVYPTAAVTLLTGTSLIAPHLSLISGTVTATSTLTVKVYGNMRSGAIISASFTVVSTSTGTYWLTESDWSALLVEGDALTSIAVNAAIDTTSSTATLKANAYCWL